MSELAADTFRSLLKKLAKLRKKQPWQSTPNSWTKPLADEGWLKVHPVMIAALDEMREEGMDRPLAPLQEIAFEAALKPNAAPHVHTAALWLTDTRLRIDAYRADPSNRDLRRDLERRGIFKSENPDDAEGRASADR